MARTAVDLTPQELELYRQTARRRARRVQKDVALRRDRAMELARRAAQLLQERFGATRVVVFGSLVREGCFTAWSDVDLAAWGLKSADTFLAIGVIYGLDPEIEVNLLDMSVCPPSLAAVIEAEGREL